MENLQETKSPVEDYLKEGLNNKEIAKVRYMIAYTQIGTATVIWKILEFNLENILMLARRGGVVKIDFI